MRARRSGFKTHFTIMLHFFTNWLCSSICMLREGGVGNRDLTKPRRQRRPQTQRQKAIGLVSKKTSGRASRFFVHFFAVSAQLQREMTNFKFFRGRERQGDKFYHLRLNSSAAPSLQFQSKFPSFQVMLHEMIRNLAQNSVVTLLRHCFDWLQHCSDIATLCCAKNRRCESSRVTSPLSNRTIWENREMVWKDAESISQWRFHRRRRCRIVRSLISTDKGNVKREQQKSNRLRSAKQRLCTCITLFCTFLCRHCTTTTWNCQISRFVEEVNTRQRLSFSFPELRCSLLESMQPQKKKMPTFHKLME